MARATKWGVIPYRFLKGGGIEVLLITTKSKKWGLPKGNMIRKLGPTRTALVEAFEEAGMEFFKIDGDSLKMIEGKGYVTLIEGNLMHVKISKI